MTTHRKPQGPIGWPLAMPDVVQQACSRNVWLFILARSAPSICVIGLFSLVQHFGIFTGTKALLIWSSIGLGSGLVFVITLRDLWMWRVRRLAQRDLDHS